MEELPIIFEDLYLDDSGNEIRDPFQRLWCSVLIMAILDLRANKDKRGTAMDFITEQNLFFDTAAEALNFEPEGLREKIKQMIENRPPEVDEFEHLKELEHQFWSDIYENRVRLRGEKRI